MDFLGGTYFIHQFRLLSIVFSTNYSNPLFSVLNTVGETTKGVPVVGEVTDPVLKTVGGVTDGLPVVSSNSESTHVLMF